MDVVALKIAVESYRSSLPKAGKPMFINKSGPPSMALIDKIVAVLESQEERIRELEFKLDIG